MAEKTNTYQKVPHGSGKCPVCGGTGWKMVKQSVQGYGYPLEFAVTCTECEIRRLQQDNTGMPVQFHDAGLDEFQFGSYSKNMDKMETLARNFLNEFGQWKKQEKGLYLWSKTPGSGKTSLACSLGNSVRMRYGLRMRFVTAPDYLAAVGDSYKRQLGDIDKSEVYRACDLLIFDDIGSQKNGEWQVQEIFRMINERLNTKKITIYTSNMPPEKLNVDDRTADRIRKSSIVLQMPEESIRLKEAQEEQEKFLGRIFSA